MTTTIMHVSDLHFGKDFLDRVAAALQRSTTELQPDITVVSGDLTQRAKQHEFEAAAVYIGKLAGAHKIVVPGNHDLPLYRVVERMTQPRQRFYQCCGALGCDTLHTEEVSIIGLDSTDYAWRAIVNGHLSDRQLQHHLIPAPFVEPSAPHSCC